LWLIVLLGLTAQLSAAEFSVKVVDREPPAEIDASIRKTLQSKVIQLLDGETPVYQFWFRTGLPLKSAVTSPAQGLHAVRETTLLAAVSVGANQRDYKDNEISPGIYTARFGLQPQDGDHLGSAEFPYFAVLIPAKTDTQLEGLSTYKTMVKASGKGTSTGHPVVLSLRPVSSPSGDLPQLSEPAPEHKSVRLQVPAQPATAGEKTTLIFDLVYYGKGKT
jgi:hypothetical protein